MHGFSGLLPVFLPPPLPHPSSSAGPPGLTRVGSLSIIPSDIAPARQVGHRPKLEEHLDRPPTKKVSRPSLLRHSSRSSRRDTARYHTTLAALYFPLRRQPASSAASHKFYAPALLVRLASTPQQEHILRPAAPSTPVLQPSDSAFPTFSRSDSYDFSLHERQLLHYNAPTVQRNVVTHAIWAACFRVGRRHSPKQDRRE